MTCSNIHDLEAFIDGELSPEAHDQIEQHLTSCNECRARFETLRAQTAMIRLSLRQERAPADLFAKIDAELTAREGASQTVQSAAWWQGMLRPMALAASLVLALGLGGIGLWQMGAADAVVAAPVQDFTTYQISGRKPDIATADPSVIQAWFEERVAFQLPEIKARIAGFDLMGGRLCWFLDRRISAIDYRRGDQIVSVYVMADHDLSLPDATFEPRLDINRSKHEVDEVTSMIWHHDRLVFAVVSDLNDADLSIFLAALARTKRLDTTLSNHSQRQPFGTRGGTT